MKGLEKWEVLLILVRIKIFLIRSIVYQFLKLVLVFPVATASVEKGFSSMNYVKNKLRNEMGITTCMIAWSPWSHLLSVCSFCKSRILISPTTSKP
jgi:hypothetical protein